MCTGFDSPVRKYQVSFLNFVTEVVDVFVNNHRAIGCDGVDEVAQAWQALTPILTTLHLLSPLRHRLLVVDVYALQQGHVKN